MITDQTSFPELSTNKLLLRQLTPEDANEIFALRSDKRVVQFVDRPLAQSIDDALAFIERINTATANGESFMWGITTGINKPISGTVCLWNFNDSKTEADLGYELLFKEQGKGIMSEAIKPVLEYAFSKLKLQKITAVVDQKNERSIKLLQKYNFIENGFNEPGMTTFNLKNPSNNNTL